MKKIFIQFAFILFVITCHSQPGKKDDSKVGFTITVDGGQFKNQTFFIPPSYATYSNLYFDYEQDPQAKRTVLNGFKLDNSLQLYIDVPIHKTTGSYTFNEDSIPVYMGFRFTYEKNSVAYNYIPGRVTVNITHYGQVGEFIEGDLSGHLHLYGEPETITITGTFRVKRIKDRR